jgi:hypothetical protein
MKKELIAILILVLAMAFLISVIEFYKKNIEAGDAKKFVLEELRTKYPYSDISIVNVADKTNAKGEKYYEIKAKVTNNAAGPCPERMHIYFNYPEQNFVSQPPEYITRDCQVCVGRDNCQILFEEEAIIASHTMSGTENVAQYISNTNGVYPVVSETENEWKVIWDSPLAEYSYVVKISKNAVLLNVQSETKAA